MSATVEVEIPALAQFERLLREAPEVTKPELSRAIKIGATTIQREEKVETPIDEGNLRNSVIIQYGDLRANVGPRVNYALRVHEGTPAGTNVNPASLEGWAKRKGLNEFAVANAIKKKGTKGNPFAERAADNSKPSVISTFDKAADRVIQKLAE